MRLVVENSERSNTREGLLSRDEIEQLKEAERIIEAVLRARHNEKELT